MGIIINLILLSVGSIFGSVYLNKRYEEMLPFTVMSIIVTLFIFYMLNIVIIGYYLILVTSLVLIILSVKKFIKEKEIRKQAIKNFFTPGLLIFGIVSFIIYIVTKENFVMLFDELRLWALYPKSIFVTDKLMLGNDLFFSSEYYPGMPLFQYFFAKNIGYFSETHLFLSYSLAMLALIMPVTRKINWKDYWAIIPMIILMFTFPMLFANHGGDALYYYRTLYIDPAVGITFGYALYLSTRNLKENKLLYILFCLSLAMVILMKIVGIFLVASVLLSYLVNQLFIYKSYKSQLKLKKKNLINYVYLFIPLLVVIFTFFSWQILVKTKLESSNPNVQSVTINRIKDISQLFINPTKDQKTFIKTYIDTIKTSPIIYKFNTINFELTVPIIMLVFIIIMIILIFSAKKFDKKIIISSALFGIFSVILLIAFYLYAYVFSFNYVVLCYLRYISPVLGGIFILLLYLLFETSISVKRKSLFYLLISCLVIIYCYNFPKISPGINYKPYYDFQDATELFADKIVKNISADKNDPVNLLTVFNYCDSVTYTCALYQHHLCLSLVDNHINALSGGLYLASEGAVPPEFYIPINSSNILLQLENYDYVFIVEDIEKINEESKILFGANPKRGDIFKKVIDKEGKITMEIVEDN